MSHNVGKQGPRDPSRINVKESGELRYWSDKFGVSPEDLKQMVREVGDRVEDVERRLGAMAGGRSGS